MIRDKTASLYGAACRLGAHYAGADAATAQALQTYGLELGTAFQIVDDCLDLAGDEQVVGKSLGTDLGKGKLTLPLLYVLQNEPGAARRLPELMGQVDGVERLRAEFDLDAAVAYAFTHAQKSVWRRRLAAIDRSCRRMGRRAVRPASAAL